MNSGLAKRTGREVGFLGLWRPGSESRQPGRDEENFPRGLLRNYPHPASVPPPGGGRDRGRRALLELRIVPAKRQSKFKTGLPTPTLNPLPPPQPVGDGRWASSPVAEEGGGSLTPVPWSRWCRA